MKARFKRIIDPSKAFILGVSVGSQNAEGASLAAIVECLNSSGLQQGIIDISDTLKRYTYQSVGLSGKDAYEKSVESGRQWRTNNDAILQNITFPYRIIHWDAWMNDGRFPVYERQFRKAFHLHAGLREAITEDVQSFYARKFNQLAQNQENLETSYDFYLEELAVMSIQFEDFPGLQIYPGKELQCLKVARCGVPDTPKGLQNSEFCRLVIH